MMPTTEAMLPDNTTPAAPPSVLKPEELQFMEDLQGKEGEVVADSTQKTPTDPKKPQPLKARDLPETKSIPMGSAAVTTSIPAQRVAPPATPGGPVAKTVPPAPKPAAAQDLRAPTAGVDPKSPFEKKTGGRFTATYQVASFPGRDQADTMAKQLAKKGVAATVHEAKSNNNVVFRVNIQLKGTDADIADALKKTGEKGPILLGKKPL
jgi:cell division protein FtsN